MARLKIDMTRYLELVQQENEIQTQGKNFREENREAILELLDYRIIFANEVLFRQRVEYLELIQNFVNEEMDGEDFHWFFLNMWRRDRDQSPAFREDFLQKGERILETDSRARPFSELIHFIFSAGESFTDTEMTDNDETNYRNEVKQYFLEMQEILKEE